MAYIYPTQPCILGNSHGLNVIIHSLWFDNPLLHIAASLTNQVGYIIQHGSHGVQCPSRANQVGYITFVTVYDAIELLKLI